MTDDSRPVSDSEIQAFVDGVLDADRKPGVTAAIAADPRLSTRVHAYQYQNSGMHALYDHCLEEPVPERMLRILESPSSVARAPSAVWRPSVLKAAVLAGVFVLGAAAGMGGYQAFLSRPPLFEPVIKQAVLAHRILETEAPEPQNLINEAGEIIDSGHVAEEFDVPLRVPSVTSIDRFEPISFRNIAGSSGPTAQVMYRDAKGRDVSLYIRPHSTTTAIPFEEAQYEGYEVIYWIDGPLVYVLVGREIGADTLARMAHTVYGARALVRRDPTAPPAAQPVLQGQ